MMVVSGEGMRAVLLSSSSSLGVKVSPIEQFIYILGGGSSGAFPFRSVGGGGGGGALRTEESICASCNIRPW